MKLYEQAKVFSERTGELLGTKTVECGYICDYCGKQILTEDDEDFNYDHDASLEISYKIFENGESEPMFHELRIPGYPQYDRYEIFNDNEYHYCRFWDNQTNCEAKMLDNPPKQLNNWTLYDIMYKARLNMLKKVLDNQQYTSEQLGLYYE